MNRSTSIQLVFIINFLVVFSGLIYQVITMSSLPGEIVDALLPQLIINSFSIITAIALCLIAHNLYNHKHR